MTNEVRWVVVTEDNVAELSKSEGHPFHDLVDRLDRTQGWGEVLVMAQYSQMGDNEKLPERNFLTLPIHILNAEGVRDYLRDLEAWRE